MRKFEQSRAVECTRRGARRLLREERFRSGLPGGAGSQTRSCASGHDPRHCGWPSRQSSCRFPVLRAAEESPDRMQFERGWQIPTALSGCDRSCRRSPRPGSRRTASRPRHHFRASEVIRAVRAVEHRFAGRFGRPDWPGAMPESPSGEFEV